MSNKINERHLDEEFLNSLYTMDNPPTASDIGAVSINELSTQIQSLIEQGVIEVGEKAYTPSNNLLETVLSSQNTTTGYKMKYLGNWIPEHSGEVKVVASLKSDNSDRAINCYAYTLSMDGVSSTGVFNVIDTCRNSSVGSVVSTNTPTGVCKCSVVGTSYKTDDAPLKVEKGVPVYFCLVTSYNGDTVTGYCNKIEIYADEV